MIKWIGQTRLAVIVSQKVTRFTSLHFYYTLAQTQALRRWHHLPTARSITAAHSLLVRHFSLSSSHPTPHYVANRVEVRRSRNDFLSWRMRYSVWIHCCQQLTYDFCISPGSECSNGIKVRWATLQPSINVACQKLLKSANFYNNNNKHICIAP